VHGSSTGRYMDVMEGLRVGLGCTGRYMVVLEGLRVGLGCTGRYMAAIEGFRRGFGCTGLLYSRAGTRTIFIPSVQGA
jgi:hypothetical protein